ncbi:hypothetical protein DL768_010519 [Monosporascus sp. mg162]|nr:hypothetical protein DL768_010519 [Monosporascus sp. mg162]
MVDLNSTLENASAGRILKKHTSECPVPFEEELREIVTFFMDQDPSSMVPFSIKSQEALDVSFLEIRPCREERFRGWIDVIEQGWMEALRMPEDERRLREQKYRELQAAEHESARRLAKHSQLRRSSAIGKEARLLKQ